MPDIECTCIGSSSISYEISEAVITRVEVYHAPSTDMFTDTWHINDEWQMEELMDQIAYDRRRIKKGWRVWRSENPDRELMVDEEE